MIVNCVQNLTIKMTKTMGRGVFATKNIEKGELLLVEKAIAVGKQDEDNLSSSLSRENKYDSTATTELV